MKLALVLALALPACTDLTIGATPQPDNTIAFTPTVITFERFAATCGVMNPPFKPDDLFSLSLLGAETVAARTEINVSFQPDIPHHQPIDVDLSPFGVIATATDASGHVTNFFGQSGSLTAGTDASFGWSQGMDPSEVDAMPLTSVEVRVDTVPQTEGAPCSIRIDMTFSDGNVLDLDVVEPVHTGFSGCPAG